MLAGPRNSLVQPCTVPCRALLRALFALMACAALCAADRPDILPLGQVKPGMKGFAYTIFAGDQIEKFDLEVIGVLPNLLGPKQSIILVELKGPKVEHTGVVAGMSGSPVYIEGKLAGALSLKFGIFTKEPLAGVTPIENMLEVESAAARQTAQGTSGSEPAPFASASAEPAASAAPPQYPIPTEVA